MKELSNLFSQLDSTNSTKAKLEFLSAYFSTQEPLDKLWTVFLLTGRKISKRVRTAHLKTWVQEVTHTPEWLFEECYATVGDLAETISLLVSDETSVEAEQSSRALSEWMTEIICPLGYLPEPEQKETVCRIWKALGSEACFIFTKIITGGFRVGVQAKIVFRALGQSVGLDPNLLATRAMGDWTPSLAFYEELCAPASRQEEHHRPFPFYLAYPIELTAEGVPKDLGDIEEWQIEWKWDGIRGQLIHTQSEDFLWSRGEEIVSHSFPELLAAVQASTDEFILDGEIIAWRDDAPLPFSETQRRIGRKTVSKKMLAEVPVAFIAYDCLKYNQEDLRALPLTKRRKILEGLVARLAHPRIILSPILSLSSWSSLAEEIAQAREKKVEGCMVKRKTSPYQVGRLKGDWWKWKVDPLTVDAVMIYAQAGHGRRAGLFTDYTFAVWKNDELVPIAKAYSGLSDKEIVSLDQWIKKNTTDRFGPVRQVKPLQVFEIAFEGIQASPRHKSGVALRFPRIKSWRKDKPVTEIDTLDTLQLLCEP